MHSGCAQSSQAKDKCVPLADEEDYFREGDEGDEAEPHPGRGPDEPNAVPPCNGDLMSHDRLRPPGPLVDYGDDDDDVSNDDASEFLGKSCCL